MHFSYGFIRNGDVGICHFHDCRVDDDPVANFDKWLTFFEDPRYRPGKTRVLMHFDDQCAYLNFEEIRERVDFIKKYNPAKLGIFVWHDVAVETAKVGSSFLRDQGVDARAFDDLDKMFKWMGMD